MYMGTPSTFVRFRGCNLHCSTCDTKYAWKEGREMTLDQIVDEVRTYKCRSVVLTGGEPLLQPMLPLIRTLSNLGYQATKETNCTKHPFQAKHYRVRWSVSPKLPSTRQTFDDSVLHSFISQGTRSTLQFKFVIDDENDFYHARKIVAEHDLIKYKKIPIILHPQGIQPSLSHYLEKLKWLVDLVKRENFDCRVLPQLHRVLWWDVKRGI